MKRKKENNVIVDYSTLKNMQDFMEKEIRNYTITANSLIEKNKLTKEEATSKHMMLVSIHRLIKRIMNCETFFKPQLNLFDTSEYEKIKNVF